MCNHPASNQGIQGTWCQHVALIIDLQLRLLTRSSTVQIVHMETKTNQAQPSNNTTNNEVTLLFFVSVEHQHHSPLQGDKTPPRTQKLKKTAVDYSHFSRLCYSRALSTFVTFDADPATIRTLPNYLAI